MIENLSGIPSSIHPCYSLSISPHRLIDDKCNTHIASGQDSPTNVRSKRDGEVAWVRPRLRSTEPMARLAKNPSAGEHRSSGRLGIVIRFISPFSVITTRSVLSITPLSSVTKMSTMVHRVNLAPAVRSAASGVPRSAVNFAIKGVNGGIGSGHAADEHGQHGPRRSPIPAWVGSRGAYMQSTNLNGECRKCGVREERCDGCRGGLRSGTGSGK